MSTTSIVLLSIFVFLFFLWVIKMVIYPWYDNNYGYNEHEVTTTTTTTVTTEEPEGEPYKFVGKLERLWENGQPYVIDPHDGDKMWLNTKDTWYEDGADRMWRLK